MNFIKEIASIYLLPIALPASRIVFGYIFILYGSAKIFHKPHMAHFDNLKPFSLFWIAGMIELIGGLFIILGLFTQPIAFILSGQMAFAYFIGHASKGHPLLPILNEGQMAVILCFAMLLIAALGAGSFSIDAFLAQ